MHCASLSAEELHGIRAVYPSPTYKLLGLGVAKLYLSRGDCPQWNETGLVGVWTFFAHEPTKTLYFQLLDLQTGSRFYTQELYEGFEYLQATPYFHTFESDDCISAFLQMKLAYLEADAQRIFRTITEVLEKKEYRMRPSTIRKAWQKFSSFATKRAAKKEEKSEAKDMVISSPTEFKHESHMGFSNGEFSHWGLNPQEWLTNNPAWKAYFQKALNISEEEVNRNAAHLFSITTDHLGMRASNSKPIAPISVPPRPANLRSQLTRSQELGDKLRRSAELASHESYDLGSSPFTPPAPPSGDSPHEREEPSPTVNNSGQDIPSPPAPPAPPVPHHFQLVPIPRQVQLPAKPEEMREEEQHDLTEALRIAFEKFRPVHDPFRDEEPDNEEEEDDPFRDDEPYFL